MLACGVQPSILIADDQSDLLDALRLLLKGEGMAMEAVTSPEATLAAVASRQFDLLLMDLNYTSDTTSGREGIDLVARVQAIDRLLPIIVMTGWGSVDLAVAAMRRGVRDFVQKPWDNSDLLRIVRAEVEERSLTQVKVGQKVQIVPESDQDSSYPGSVVRIAGVMGSRKLRSDDPSERADERVVEVVVDAEQAPVLVGQRVLVKFLKAGAKAGAAAEKTAER